MSTHNAEAAAGGPGPVGHDSRRLMIAWIAVASMVIGFGLLALGLIVHPARVPLWIAGGAIGLVGVVLAFAGRIMDLYE